jgi:polyferredoxin
VLAGSYSVGEKERPLKLPRIQLFRKRSIWPRKVLQLLFFILIALISLNHTLVQNGGGLPFFQNVSLHALCPFGGVETMAQLLITGTLIQKVRVSSVFLLDLILILSVLFGPVFCGWVCPLGTVQEWVGKMGRHWFGSKRYNHFVPGWLDGILRYARYIVLAWVLYFTIISAKLVFQDYDPYFALFHFWSGEVAPAALLILETTLLLALFVERPWCKYACPFGALLGLSNFIRIFAIQRKDATCRHKGDACATLCPMNIEISKKTVIRDHQCITCLECTYEACCPIKETIFLGTGNAS